MSTNKTSNLFNVRFRPAVAVPHQILLCQKIEVAGEQLIWLDGIDSVNPALLPMAAAASVEPAGDFNALVCSNLESARQIIELSGGNHSITILARAIAWMSMDRSLTAELALELVIEQATDLLELDRQEGHFFESICN